MKINGLPVVDAKKPLKLKIINSDLIKALENRKTNKKAPISRICVAAVALERQMRNCTEAYINRARSFAKIGNKYYKRYNTGPALRDATIAFDSGGKFPLGEYDLLPLSKSERAGRGRAHSLNAPKHGRPGKERKKYIMLKVARPRSQLSNFSAEI